MKLIYLIYTFVMVFASDSTNNSAFDERQERCENHTPFKVEYTIRSLSVSEFKNGIVPVLYQYSRE
ncbi:MAG: hypothetical protein ACFCU6_05875 [Balneolaceae bacterium]